MVLWPQHLGFAFVGFIGKSKMHSGLDFERAVLMRFNTEIDLKMLTNCNLRYQKNLGNNFSNKTFSYYTTEFKFAFGRPALINC